jgi:predicted pyridoxine 5'-phosphate oxidase superfamily flavin-nucleotide-binding protein
MRKGANALERGEHNALPGSAGEHALQERFKVEDRACAFYENQMIDHLNAAMRSFIAKQEMVFISTADGKGECDCSFRAGLPGFVFVLDEETLLYPEYTGNGVLASLGNIQENPHVGMVFIDFFENTIGLHVNGKAKILTNIELFRRPKLPKEIRRDMGVKGGRKPRLWVLVEVEEAYIHCSKHIPLLKKLEKTIHWGTDNILHKGGDYFRAKGSPRPWGKRADKNKPGASTR